MARNWETNPHPMANTYRTLSNGRKVWIDERGTAHFVSPSGNLVGAQHPCPVCGVPGHDVDDCVAYEGPHCSICDGLGHGYPGGPPCPLEVDDRYAGSQEEARDRYLESLAEQAKEDRLDARDEAKEWGGEDIPS
jgi:hypothetical protein